MLGALGHTCPTMYHMVDACSSHGSKLAFLEQVSQCGPEKQDPKTLHSSEKSWGGRLVERQRPEGLPVQPPCRLVILEGEASIGVELLFWPCPSNNTISPQEDRLRLAVSRRSTSRGWPAMPPPGPPGLAGAGPQGRPGPPVYQGNKDYQGHRRRQSRASGFHSG